MHPADLQKHAADPKKYILGEKSILIYLAIVALQISCDGREEIKRVQRFIFFSHFQKFSARTVKDRTVIRRIKREVWDNKEHKNYTCNVEHDMQMLLENL